VYKIIIHVTLKKDVLDPQGKAISEAANSLGIKNILDIKQGKYFEVLLNNVSDKNKAEQITKNLSEKLLCNEVIEDYKIVTIKKA
tara:strand:+ start:210 stop:464 length:255 start_codon:yes stop_codon:yes gene_type:complete